MIKREYSKPEIVFEDFSLSTSIAANCEVFPNNNTEYNVCGRVIPGVGAVFLTDVEGCTDKKLETDKEYNYMCYHVPNTQNNLFNS